MQATDINMNATPVQPATPVSTQGDHSSSPAPAIFCLPLPTGQQWSDVRSSVASIASTASKQAAQAARAIDAQAKSSGITESYATFAQQLKEKAGVVKAEDITELPQEYLELKGRVDSLANAYRFLIKVGRTYESESYDYPNSTIQDLALSAGTTLTSWTRIATKGTLLAQPEADVKVGHVPKTLPHALSVTSRRAAAEIASDEDQQRLVTGLNAYATAQETIGGLRLDQDKEIVRGFVEPWSVQLTGPIGEAQKSAQAVDQARLTLDVARAALKIAKRDRQEQLQTEVAAAEERLVKTIEDTVVQMNAVLKSPEAVKALPNLIKAQQAYHAQAADALQAILADAEEASLQADANQAEPRDE